MGTGTPDQGVGASLGSVLERISGALGVPEEAGVAAPSGGEVGGEVADTEEREDVGGTAPETEGAEPSLLEELLAGV